MTPLPCSEHEHYVAGCPLCNLQDQLDEAYRTPRWERILLAVVLVVLALVAVSAIASIVVPAARA